MASLSPRMKELIEEEIGLIDRWIDEAIKQVGAADSSGQDAGKRLDEAVAAVDEAIKRKLQRLVTKFPDINVDGKSFSLPFFPIYELFVDIDSLVDQLQARIAMDHAGIPLSPGTVSIQTLIATLKELIRELELNLIKKPWFKGDEVPGILERLRAKLKRVIEAAERFQRTGEFDPNNFTGVDSRKKDFLDEVSDQISLWDVYSLLVSLDQNLAMARHLIATNRPLKGRLLNVALAHLEMAIAVKHKLLDLVRGTPARRPKADDPFDEKLHPRRPEAPEPKYEPGQEDLPPFPPDPDPSDPHGPHYA